MQKWIAYAFTGFALSLLPLATCATETLSNGGTPLLHTGVTGRISASGLNDPQYVLSFLPVQKLMLSAVEHPLKQVDIERGLQGTPVSIDDLLRLELLRRDEAGYRLNYLLLTVRDQKTIYETGKFFGQSLATAFQAHRSEFDQIVEGYPNPTMRSKLLFDLVAGAALNWGGLDLTTELGYRIKPPRHENGDIYFVHSEEVGATLDSKGLYLDSETASGSTMSFTTFGDGDPRLEGLPDVFDGVDTAVESWRSLPGVYGALRSEYITYILMALDDAGQVMNAVAHGFDTDIKIANHISVPRNRLLAAIHLLTATGYLNIADARYSAGVPVLTEKDMRMVSDALQLSQRIMSEWLQQNYSTIRDQLTSLSPMRNGVPFALVFSEVWHYTFGFASRSLAESGFYANPHAPGAQYEGYMPLVWANSVLKGPGE